MSAPSPRYQTIPLTRPLPWEGFILHVLTNNQSRIFDAAERTAWCDRYWAANPKLEAQQWRRSGQHAAKSEQVAA